MQQDDKMSEDDFAKHYNSISLIVAEYGIDTDQSTGVIVDKILKYNKFLSDDEETEVINTIHDILFKEQLESYIKGCEYFNSNFMKITENLKIECSCVDIDTILDKDVISQESIINSTYMMVSAVIKYLKEETDDCGSEAESSFENRIRCLVSLYLNTSFILGLTAAKMLNYSVNQDEGVVLDGVITALNKAYPSNF